MTDNHKIVQAEVVQIEPTEMDGMHPIVQAAMKGSQVDTQTLRELMELQREYQAMEAKKAFTRAMVALKNELPSVINRDKKVDFGQGKTKYSFATLASAMKEIAPHLSTYGFALSWIPVTKDGMVSVTCRLTHTDGHYDETTLTAKPDVSGSKNSVQAIGSTITYLERYTSMALLGIATRDMPDADDAPPPDDTIDENKNLEAVAYLKKWGINLKDAEAHVQKGVRDWTAGDLATLREYVKTNGKKK